MATKTEFVGFSLDRETRRKLHELAKAYENNASMTVRQLIREKHAAILAAAQQEQAQETVNA